MLRNRVMLLCSIFLLLAFGIAANAAGQGEEQLRAFLDDLDTFQADFRQQLFSESEELLETASGRFYLQRPGRFSWEYREPYEQKIITNGETLWIYDADLEQVTIRNVESGLQSTPAAILGGTANLDELYEIVEMGELEGYDWVRLKSTDPESQYNDVRLGFDSGRLGMMILTDNFGQTTRIDFSNIESNVDIAADTFEFTPPPDVDVLDDREQ